MRWRHAPAVVLAAALAVRVVCALALPGRYVFPDSGRYDAMARRLLAGEGLVVNTAYPFLAPELKGRGYLAHSPPGYPVLLAALHVLGLGSPRAVRLVQAVLGAAAVWLVMVLARRILPGQLGREGAVIAGAVAAFEPHLIFFSGLVLTETLFTLLLMASLVFLARTQRKGNRTASPRRHGGTENGGARDCLSSVTPCLRGGRSLFAAAAWGALSGAAVLVRSTFILFLPACAVADVLIARRSERKARLLTQLLALGVFALALAPWTVRNAVRLGAFVPGGTNLGIGLYMSLGPEACGSWDSSRIRWPEEELAPLGELERDRYLTRAALGHAVTHPGRSLGLAALSVAHLWRPVSRAAGYRTWPYVAVALLSFLLLIGAAAAGTALRRREWRTWWPALAPAAYLTMLSLVILGSVRYRVPAHAAMAVMAGAGYAALARRLGTGRPGGKPDDRPDDVPDDIPEEPVT